MEQFIQIQLYLHCSSEPWLFVP